ncbi:MAG: class I SAM-dependent methyltransferase [Thermodesulfobacteriota bacterium]|nr:class I SAM-dependent methyltransferase [Thermodesulfobacteriota bacterium]
MPKVFWSGKLPFDTMCLMNASNFIAFLCGNTMNKEPMKLRMKNGYDGVFSDDVTRYDELGLGHYSNVAEKLVSRIDVLGKRVLDVGCGTGILTLSLLKHGAAKVICGDFAENMLSRCRNNLSSSGYEADRVTVKNFDADNLPYEDNSFDVVVSGMMLGLTPDQQGIISEMVRVLRPGGTLAFSTHGPGHYMEACDGLLRAAPKRYALGYRVEFWPQSKKSVEKLLSREPLKSFKTFNEVWEEEFDRGEAAYDFFASTSSSWWIERVPESKRQVESDKVRNFFNENNITSITSDVVFAYGVKQ